MLMRPLGLTQETIDSDLCFYVAQEFEIAEVAVDGIYDAQVVGIDEVCAVVVGFDDEQHALFEVFG